MKKKIKELTLEECKKICKKYLKEEDCPPNCPLIEINFSLCYFLLDSSKKVLEQEVEVDE